MKAHLRKYLGEFLEAFWLVPGGMAFLGVAIAHSAIAIDRSGALPDASSLRLLLYDGGPTGARTLLGTVASSAIGVAGTIFSITIAALSLAAGQMGPRLLRNFVHDRGNQISLGAFLGTFTFSLVTLRSVRTEQEGLFVPHLALGLSMAFAFACVGVLVYFVGHMAGRINVDTVIALVSKDVGRGMRRLAQDEPGPEAPPSEFWADARGVAQPQRGYLQYIDTDALTRWAVEHDASILLLGGPGSYVFPNATLALVRDKGDGTPPDADAVGAILVKTIAVGEMRESRDDIELAVRHLVEVAVRALSPGINDPNTARSVLDRLGATLCELIGCHMPTGVHLHEGRPVVVIPMATYDGLTDAMFHTIRQNAATAPSVLIRMLDVFIAVASCEPRADRLGSLTRHANAVLSDAERTIGSLGDLADIRARHAAFVTVSTRGVVALVAQTT